MTGPLGQVIQQTYTATVTMPVTRQQGTVLENLQMIEAILELGKAECMETWCIKALLQSIVAEM